LPGVLQSPFLELKEDPGGIPVEVIPPGVVPEEIDFNNCRITDKACDPRLSVYPDVICFDARYRTQHQ